MRTFPQPGQAQNPQPSRPAWYRAQCRMVSVWLRQTHSPGPLKSPGDARYSVGPISWGHRTPSTSTGLKIRTVRMCLMVGFTSLAGTVLWFLAVCPRIKERVTEAAQSDVTHGTASSHSRQTWCHLQGTQQVCMRLAVTCAKTSSPPTPIPGCWPFPSGRPSLETLPTHRH